MPSQRLKKAFKKAWNKQEQDRWTYGWVGKKIAGADPEFVVPGLPNHLFVTLRRAEGAQTVVSARNDDGVPHSLGLAVRLRMEGETYVIEGRSGREDLSKPIPSLPSGVPSHDHPFYLDQDEADARYYQKTEFINVTTGVSDAGKPIKTDALGLLAPSFVLGPEQTVPENANQFLIVDDGVLKWVEWETITALFPAAYTDEQARDAVGAALVEGAGVDITVNDAGDTITIASTITQYTDEMARDALGAALVAGTGITITPNDGADTITVATTITQYTDEMARDAIGTALVEGAGIDITVDDAGNIITIASTITQYTDENARDALGTALTEGNGIDIAVSDPSDTITLALQALTSDWDIGEDKRILAEFIRARDNEGLKLGDDADDTYIHITDAGPVEIRRPAATNSMLLRLNSTLAFTEGGVTYNTGFMQLGDADEISLAIVRDTSTDAILRGAVDADTVARFHIDVTGLQSWGSGTATRNISLGRDATLGTLFVTSATLNELVRFISTTGLLGTDQGEVSIGFDARATNTTTPGAMIRVKESDVSDNRHDMYLQVKTVNDTTTATETLISLLSQNKYIGFHTEAPQFPMHFKGNGAVGGSNGSVFVIENIGSGGLATFRVLNDASSFFQFSGFGSAFAGSNLGTLRAGKLMCIASGAETVFGTETSHDFGISTNATRRLTVDAGGGVRILTTLKALSSTGLQFEDDGGNFAAKIFDGGGMTKFVNSDKGDVIYETLAVANIAVQLAMTRPTSTTVVRGFWATINMVGRISTTVYGGSVRIYVQGRSGATIQFGTASNQNITITTVTQTSTNLTLKFLITGAAGAWAEFAASIVADSPLDADWTLAGSQVA